MSDPPLLSSSARRERWCLRNHLESLRERELRNSAPLEASADGVNLEPWRGEPLSLGNEIDKLASNIALARDAAGVHFRSDSISGLKLGEAVAIGLLADYSRTYSERFDGFTLTRFDGDTVRISGGSAQSAEEP